MNKLKAAFRWAKNKLVDPLNLKIFFIVFTVLSSPVYIGFIFWFIFNDPFWLGIATGWLMIWNVIPCTPFIGVCVLLTLGIRKICNYITKKIRRGLYGS